MTVPRLSPVDILDVATELERQAAAGWVRAAELWSQAIRDYEAGLGAGKFFRSGLALKSSHERIEAIRATARGLEREARILRQAATAVLCPPSADPVRAQA